MNQGDLVQLFVYSPHTSTSGRLSTNSAYTGIFIEKVNNFGIEWIVLTKNGLKSFPERYWRCRGIKNEVW